MMLDEADDNSERALAFVSDSELSSIGGRGKSLPRPGAVPTPLGTASLIEVLGAAGVRSLDPSTPAVAKGQQPWTLSPTGAGAGTALTGVSAVFGQVLRVLQTLQQRLQESEAMAADLQVQADTLEEKRRGLGRRAELADRDRDAALLRCTEAEAAARRAREEAAPVVERFMEAEVLRSQLQVTGDELLRLREEVRTCKEELAQGWPKLQEAEEAEAECREAVAELESAHAEEVAVLKALHLQEVSQMRTEHAARLSELEAARHEEVAALKRANSDEIGRLRSALEAARWQAEVIVRETQDAVRETCLRQRENARLAKRHGEARQEALELAARLESLRALEVGAPAREAELHAVRRRFYLLQQTAAEWREALVRKQGDCDKWHQEAVKRGTEIDDEDVQAELQALADAALSVSPERASDDGLRDRAGRFALGNSISPIRYLDIPSSASGVWSGVPTPARTPQRTPAGSRPADSRVSRSASATTFTAFVGSRTVSAPVTPLDSARRPVLSPPQQSATTSPTRQAAGRLPPSAGKISPALEFVAVVLRAARLRSKVADGEAGPETEGALTEAENEVEMLAFLLDEPDVAEAVALLAQEAQNQPQTVALSLLEQSQELASRSGRRALSPSYGQ